jgi:uncharacterized protein (TIGR02231 family)
MSIPPPRKPKVENLFDESLENDDLFHTKITSELLQRGDVPLVTSEINSVPEIPSGPPEPKEALTPSKIPRIEYEEKLCPIESVKVYTKSVQVFRKMELTLENKDQEIVITGVPFTIDAASIRCQADGDVLIDEVYNTTKVIKIVNDMTTRETIQKEMKTLIEKRNLLKMEIRRANHEDDFLGQYANSLVALDRTNKDLEELVKKDTIGNIADFMKYYRENVERIDAGRYALTKQVEVMNKRLQELLTLFNNEKAPYELKTLNCICVLLSPTVKDNKELKITLNVEYVNNNAFWTSSYDIRRDSTKNKIDVTYYGNITQNTQEEWKNVKLALSTADPSSKNSPPIISTLNVNFNYGRIPMAKKSNSAFGGVVRRKEMMRDAKSPRDPNEYDDGIDDEEGGGAPEMNLSTTTTEDSTTSTNFIIPNETTIPSDGTPHRVTIAVLQYDCSFVYFTVPKVDAKVYVKCTATNTSTYPFVEGPSNIFVDNQFIGKGKIQNIATNEKFDTYLGVDPSIRIEYKPPQRFKETKGWIRGTNKMNVERRILIKNTRSENIKIVIQEQVPQPTEGSITVELVEPPIPKYGDLKDPITNYKVGNVSVEKLVRNVYNNLEYTIVVAGGKEALIPVKYLVSWPASLQITPDY